jgi:hypothetical protein
MAIDPTPLRQDAEDISERVTLVTTKEAWETGSDSDSKIRKITDRVQSRAKEIGERARNVDETTIPDAFRRVPKYISPRVHSWLAFAVSTYFVGLGVWFAMHGRGRAATAAFINGAMVAGVSLLTDYDGDAEKPISFKMHGTFDAVQAATAALGPVFCGFADEPEAKYFWGQAAKELGIIATTDWDAGMPKSGFDVV